MLNRKKREEEVEMKTYGAGRRKRNIVVPPPQKNYISTDDAVADTGAREEAELTPEEQLEVDFPVCDCFEATPVVRQARKKDDDSDFEGLEIADEEELACKENGCSITEILNREKLQYVADADDDIDDAEEAYNSDELEKDVAMDVEESITEGDESDRLYENFTSSDTDRESLAVAENETVEQVSYSIENLPSTVTLNSRKSISSYTIPEPDEGENLFRPEDYINFLDFEVNADPTDIWFQRKQFEFYGVEKNGRKFNLDTATFAKALTKKLTAKIFNTQLFLYNNHRGIFEPVSDVEFKRITYRILNEIGDGVWKRNQQVEYVEAFKYEAEQYATFIYNRRYLSFNNCTLDLRTMKTLPHSPFLNSTNYLGYDYDETAKCPLWEDTLNKIFLGDKAVIESFREMFGCFLIHGKGQGVDKLFILYGNGSNGKSLCTNVIKDVLTEKNCSAKEFANIGQKFSLSTIYDKFVNISSENQKVITDTAIYKAIASSDSVDIERKYQDSYSAVPYVKLVCSTNKLPQFNDDSNGMLRRIHIFNFKARFVDNNNGYVLGKNEFLKDHTLFEKLHEERAGILNWALIGTQRLLNNDYVFSMPTAVRRYNEDFALNLNPVKIFLDSCISNKQGNRIKTTEVVSHYHSWAELHDVKNQRFHGNQQFHRSFKECLAESDLTAKTLQIKGYDYYCDFEIDTSYPLTLPQCF
ncbi:MAG: hypothetical protein IKU39_05980 [Lachnospiraceae bacterium]|nr:hypothetical protein [Lachnospiraceae bacterium]